MTNPKCPRNQARVLTTSFKMGMAITLALARDRATGKSRPLYFGQGNRILGMAEIWKRAKQQYQETVETHQPDASVLLKTEHSIRRSFSRILLKTSVRYGNTETKRVKREEGDKGYLNILWDYGGSRIRDVVKARYFFSRPVLIERDDGKTILGYPGSAKTPMYPVRHNHLPELDFGDMIRSPLMELTRQCLKYGVPIKAAKKHIDALLYRLIPFLDYVYTERRSGRSNYVRDGLKELRGVINQIKVKYGTRNGQRQPIIAQVKEAMSSDSVQEESEEQTQDDELHFLEKVIESARKEGVLENYLEQVENLLGNNILTLDDSEELLKRKAEQSRRIGSQLHRFVAKNFPSPFSLNGIIFHGTEMAYDDSGLILFSEVPVDDGRGRVDFVFARAKKLRKVDGAPSSIYCEPFLVVDLKSKSAFDFDIYGMQTRSSKSEITVGEFILERRPLTDEEWRNALGNTPDNYEKGQLDAYETALIADYEDVMKRDNDRQKRLAKAIIVVDSFQNWRGISEAVLPLILKAYNGCVDGSLSDGDYLLPSELDSSMRIAMKMLSVAKPVTDTVSIGEPILLKPFVERRDDKKEFILYLTISGSGSQAQSAAVIAKRWHGLQYLHSLGEKKHRDVFWLDLIGEYKDPLLRDRLFRMKFHTDQIRRFFKRRVQLRDVSEKVRGCILEGESIRTLHTDVCSMVKDSRNPIVVVSGWEALRRSTPESDSVHLDEVVVAIMQALPDGCTVLWFANPVPAAQSSLTYSTRCVTPFFPGTLWQNFVDAIVWNVVMPPDRTGARAPANDHERGIFIERPGESVESEMIEVEPLRGWGESFRPGGQKKPAIYHKGGGRVISQSSEYKNQQLDHALDLLPHILAESEYNQKPLSNDLLEIKQVTDEKYPVHEARPFLSYRPIQIYTGKDESKGFKEGAVDGRFRTLLPIGNINQRREYRPMKLGTFPPKRVTVPPTEHYLTLNEIGDGEIAHKEIRHLKDTIKFLRFHSDTNLMRLLEIVSESLDNLSTEDSPVTLMNGLRLVRQILERDECSRELWNRLLPHRATISSKLLKNQQKHVASIQKKHPDILLITGNHLFLLLLLAIKNDSDSPHISVLNSLWDYLQPWQMMELGFKTRYPRGHEGRRSVLDRHRLLPRLTKRLGELNQEIETMHSLTKVRFGQLIVGSGHLWLLFQRSPGTQDLNAALLDVRGFDLSLPPHEVLQWIVSDKTLWTESDISLLSQHAKLQDNESRIPILVAVQNGVQCVWISDLERPEWVPVGRIQFSTRRFEDVTLVRTVSVSSDPHLRSVSYDDVRRPIHGLVDMVDRALLILDHALAGCSRAKCKVSLDIEEQMYHVSFNEQGNDCFLGELLISRTDDLLEILRRPDNDCEPVLVNGNRLIWNRFLDISYDSDTELLKSWVVRREPFEGLPMKLPRTAKDLLEAIKDYDFMMELYHDPWTCPLKHISLEAIRMLQNQVEKFGEKYALKYASQWAEPESISNEPGLHHGSCWRVRIDTPHVLTPELLKLMSVRLTDAQARSLLGPQELVYWSEERQGYVTHTFKVVLKSSCIKEAQESWHIRTLLEDMTGHSYDASVPGTYLQSPDRWAPFITIDPECVKMGLIDGRTGLDTERVIHERNVALKSSEEVQEFLENEMENYLELNGIIADRRLTAAIREEIRAAIEIYGVRVEGAEVELLSVEIKKDSAGGRIIYVILVSENETHHIPVTKYLHNIREVGRVDRDEFVSDVRQKLDDYNLNAVDIEEALKECVRLMRSEKLIQ